MSLPSARGQLKSAFSQIMLHWEETRAKWDDPVSRKFEKDFLLPMDPPARATFSAMEAMTDLLAKARRDCQ